MDTTKKPKSRVSQGIAFEPALLPAAKARAASKRQSFSAYINSLISADVGCQLPATEPAAVEHPGQHATAAAA